MSSLLLFTSLLKAQPAFNWAIGTGGPSPLDRDIAHCVSSDNAGNVYMAGQFQDTITFGSFTMIALASRDGFVAKFDPNGNCLWVMQVMGGGLDLVQGIETTSNGESYITGEFSGLTTIVGGNFLLNSSNTNADMFAAKIDVNGNALWALTFPATTDSRGNCITTDGLGNCYVGGQFQGTATVLSQNYTSASMVDPFFMKINSTGTIQWFKHVPVTGMNDTPWGIKADFCGNILITGTYGGTANFPCGAITDVGSGDIFISKYDPNGNCLWAVSAGGNATDGGNGISLDAAGNVFVTGKYAGMATFGTFTVNAQGLNYNGFIAKLNSSGVFQWVKKFGAGGQGNPADEGNAIATDSIGNSYVTGYFNDTATFGQFTMIATGGLNKNDVCIMKLNPNGVYQWVKQAGGSDREGGRGICIAKPHLVYVCGVYQSDTCWFDNFQVYTPINNINSSGQWENLFLTEFNENLSGFNTNMNLQLSGNTNICSGNSATLSCNTGTNFLWSPGNNTTQSITVSPTVTTTYYATVTIGGCTLTDSIIVNVTSAPNILVSGDSSICNGNIAQMNVTGGASYSWSTGETTSGISVNPNSTTIYSVITTNSCGIDTSYFTVTVVNNPIAVISGDSLICSGETTILTASGVSNYLWNNASTTPSVNVSPISSSSYFVVSSTSGCSDTSFYFVTVVNSPTISLTGNTNIIFGQSLNLTASASGIVTYNWNPSNSLSCSTCSNPIASPTTTTTYCVEVTNSGGCSNTSCVTVTIDILCGELFVPTAFTPNGDGMNDVIKVNNNCLLEIDFRIYTRWGELVFSSTDLNGMWDGKYKGKEMDESVFAYTLEATLNTGEKLSQKGNISLIR